MTRRATDVLPVLGYGTNGFADHTLECALDVMEGAGYRAVALTLGHPHLDPFAPDWCERTIELRDSLARRGLRVVVETGARYLLDPLVKHRPTLVDAECAPRLVFLERAIEIARILGADAVSLWSGVVPEGTSSGEAWERLVERMRRIVAAAETADVRLGFEPEPGMLVQTVADALRLRADLGSPAAFGITVDLGHCLVVEPGGVDGALRQAGDLLVNVQVDDMLPGAHEHLELGAGMLDLGAALETLAAIGYRGIAAVELPRHSHDAPRLAVSSMAAVRRAADAGWLARAAAAVSHEPARIDELFPAVGREVGRSLVDPAGRPAGPTLDDAARARLIETVAGVVDAEHLAATVLRLYRSGDGAERRGAIAGLNALAAAAAPLDAPLVEVGQTIVADALRANDARLVAAAMGAFAGRHLDAHSWRHGVLKLVFQGVDLAAVDRLGERRDAELGRMAFDYAEERRAAARPVPPDVDLLVAARPVDAHPAVKAPTVASH